MKDPKEYQEKITFNLSVDENNIIEN